MAKFVNKGTDESPAWVYETEPGVDYEYAGGKPPAALTDPNTYMKPQAQQSTAAEGIFPATKAPPQFSGNPDAAVWNLPGVVHQWETQGLLPNLNPKGWQYQPGISNAYQQERNRVNLLPQYQQYTPDARAAQAQARNWEMAGLNLLRPYAQGDASVAREQAEVEREALAQQIASQTAGRRYDPMAQFGGQMAYARGAADLGAKSSIAAAQERQQAINAYMQGAGQMRGADVSQFGQESALEKSLRDYAMLKEANQQAWQKLGLGEKMAGMATEQDWQKQQMAAKQWEMSEALRALGKEVGGGTDWGSVAGGAMSAIGGLAAMFSDERTKQDITSAEMQPSSAKANLLPTSMQPSAASAMPFAGVSMQPKVGNPTPIIPLAGLTMQPKIDAPHEIPYLGGIQERVDTPHDLFNSPKPFYLGTANGEYGHRAIDKTPFWAKQGKQVPVPPGATTKLLFPPQDPFASVSDLSPNTGSIGAITGGLSELSNAQPIGGQMLPASNTAKPFAPFTYNPISTPPGMTSSTAALPPTMLPASQTAIPIEAQLSSATATPIAPAGTAPLPSAALPSLRAGVPIPSAVRASLPPTPAPELPPELGMSSLAASPLLLAAQQPQFSGWMMSDERSKNAGKRAAKFAGLGQDAPENDPSMAAAAKLAALQRLVAQAQSTGAAGPTAFGSDKLTTALGITPAMESAMQGSMPPAAPGDKYAARGIYDALSKRMSADPLKTALGITPEMRTAMNTANMLNAQPTPNTPSLMPAYEGDPDAKWYQKLGAFISDTQAKSPPSPIPTPDNPWAMCDEQAKMAADNGNPALAGFWKGLAKRKKQEALDWGNAGAGAPVGAGLGAAASAGVEQAASDAAAEGLKPPPPVKLEGLGEQPTGKDDAAWNALGEKLGAVGEQYGGKAAGAIVGGTDPNAPMSAALSAGMPEVEKGMEAPGAGGLGGEQMAAGLGMMGKGIGGIISGLTRRGTYQPIDSLAPMPVGGGPLAGVASSLLSDERSKMPEADSPLHEFLTKLKPKQFRYKPPFDELYGDDKRTGIMAQDMAKSDIGAEMVAPEPRTGLLMVNTEPSKFNPLVLAALSHLSHRLDKVEG